MLVAGRSPVDVHAPPWRGVVRVQTELGVRCSGALIGSRRVLTAAHCVFAPETGRLVQPSSVHVLTGYDRGAYAGHARAIAMQLGPGFALRPGLRPIASVPLATDWALLTLDSPIGTPDRVLPVQRTAVPLGTAVMLGGYEQDRAQTMLADLACRVVGETAGLLFHDCAGTRGVSGAPLLARAADGRWAVIGIASRAWAGAAGGYAVSAAAIPALTRSKPP